MNNVSQWWGLFIVCYRCIFCLALVNVTSAVFITETTRVASDDEVLMLRKQFVDRKNKRVLTELFNEIDESGDGIVTLQGFALVFEDDKVMRSLLELMDLEVRDVEELFQMMDDGSGLVDRDRFITSILSMRGHAKSSSQTRMMALVKSIHTKLGGISQGLGAHADSPVTVEFGGSVRTVSGYGLG
eukprot:UN3924